MVPSLTMGRLLTSAWGSVPFVSVRLRLGKSDFEKYDPAQTGLIKGSYHDSKLAMVRARAPSDLPI
eukprot:1021128-Prorocentrum_minimum.AAC.1